MMLKDLTDDDRRVIVENVDPDWRDHFLDTDQAWKFYESSDELLTAIENYKR